MLARGEAYQFQYLGDARIPVCHAIHAGIKIEVFPGAQVAVQIALVRHQAQPGAHFFGIILDIQPFDEYASGGRAHDAGQYFDERGLARSVGAENRQRRPSRDAEVDATQRFVIAERFDQSGRFHSQRHS